jgi:hypothetical protein
LGFLPVVPMTIISALLMIMVSTLTRSSLPGAATLARYFDNESPTAREFSIPNS